MLKKGQDLNSAMLDYHCCGSWSSSLQSSPPSSGQTEMTKGHTLCLPSLPGPLLPCGRRKHYTLLAGHRFVHLMPAFCAEPWFTFPNLCWKLYGPQHHDNQTRENSSLPDSVFTQVTYQQCKTDIF